nr:tubulin-folding cofactor B [Ipomoea batatas]
MASVLQNIPADDSVLIRVTHANIKSFSADIRFSLHVTVEAVKEKLWKKCGTSVSSMRLELYDDTGAKISDLSDNTRPFGFYSPHDGYRLHVIDTDPSSVTSGGWLEDTSLVEKYTISEEAYDKRDGTFKKFKEKLACKSATDYEAKICDNYMEDLCAHIKIGDRCQVELGERRGNVKFVGQAKTLAPGFWVGVQYDEPVGKHDGMVKGKRYFSCPPLHGEMVRPDKVKVGDYPERDPFEEEEI